MLIQEVAGEFAGRVNLKPAYRIVAGTPEVLKAMGTVAAVPKLFIFDQTGARAEVIYGAAPDLHDRIERVLRRLATR